MFSLIIAHVGYFDIVTRTGILFPFSFEDCGNLTFLIEPVFDEEIGKFIAFCPVISINVALSSCDESLLNGFQFSPGPLNSGNQIFQILVLQI